MKLLSEVRYDLEVVYEGLERDTVRDLFRLSSRWRAQNARLVRERLQREVEGPRVLQ